MAYDKVVDSAQLDADLAIVANAIREKGGTSAELAFPGGFVDAVEAISTGGGRWTENEVGADIVGPNLSTVPQLTGDYVEVTGECARAYAFYYSGIKNLKLTLTKNRSGWSIGERYCSFNAVLEDVLYNPPANGVGGISGYVFWGCHSLKRVRITGNVTYINSQRPFGDCPALTDIYVTWAEGAISGAPWGAENATIHYNTQFDADGNIVG